MQQSIRVHTKRFFSDHPPEFTRACNAAAINLSWSWPFSQYPGNEAFSHALEPTASLAIQGCIGTNSTASLPIKSSSLHGLLLPAEGSV